MANDAALPDTLSLDILDRPDLPALIPALQASSEAGNPAASYLLGLLYELAIGTKRDFALTATYHCRAMEQDADALIRLEETPPVNPRHQVRPGTEAMFRMSRLAMAVGDEAGYANALHCFSRLAAWGDDRALAHLALMTLWGMGVPNNNEEGLRMLRAAAQQGAIVALDELGWLEVQGQLVPKNVAGGLAKLRQAAEAGYGQAQSRLGQLLVEGRILPRDLDAGADWLGQAAVQGYAGAFHAYGTLLAEHGDDDDSFSEGICYLDLAVDSGIVAAKGDLDSARQQAPAEVVAAATAQRAAWQMHPSRESTQLMPFAYAAVNEG
jgi:TPR repeat protein